MDDLRNIILRDAFKKNITLVQPHSFYEAAMGFIHAIDWTEPWIVTVLCFHVMLAVVVGVTRDIPNVQIMLFLSICICVYLAQYVNAVFGEQWEELGFSQNYFDENGAFISLVFSAPLLAMALFQMVRDNHSVTLVKV
jgi:hypothetical protein